MQSAGSLRGNDEAVADAGDIDDQLDGGVADRPPLGHEAPQGSDHGPAASRSRPAWPGAGAGTRTPAPRTAVLR